MKDLSNMPKVSTNMISDEVSQVLQSYRFGKLQNVRKVRLSRSDVKRVIDTFIELMENHLLDDDIVTLRGIGSIYVTDSKRPSNFIKSPKKAQKYRKQVYFTPTRRFKTEIHELHRK